MKTMIVSSYLLSALIAGAVEPSPKSPSQEKVEEIQKSGGAIKIEDTLPIEDFKPLDPAMTVIEKTSEENKKTVQLKESEHMLGIDAVLGLPHPLNIGVLYIHSSKSFSAEANTGSFGMKFQDNDVKIENYDYHFRWHPLKNSFYVGVGFGHQKLEVKRNETISNQSVSAKASLDTPYTLPQIGWILDYKDAGFFWGLQLAWQMPSSHKTKFTTSVDLTGTPEYDQLVADVRKQGDDLGKISIPNIALFKFGWIF